MKGFEPITLTWRGEEWEVPADRQMELIMRVEDGLVRGRPVQAYEVLGSGAVPPIGQLASVFGDALRYAGARVPAVDIYKALVKSMTTDGADIVDVVRQISGILGLLASDAEAPTGEAPKAKKPKAPAV